MWRRALRMGLRVAGWSLAGATALAVVFFIAWLPFNLNDVDPRPRAAELQPLPMRVPDERNAAYAVQGLLAEAGRDPAATGRAVWAQHRAWAALPPAQRASEADARDARVKALTGTPVAVPRGAPWVCAGQRNNCNADWLAQAEALDKQRSAFAAVGERCEKLVDGAFEFEELPPAGRGLDAILMNWHPMTECSRWFRSGAMLALARGQRDEALVQLKRAERQQRQVAAGARGLLGHMAAARLARNTYDTMAAAALREPALADTMAAWLEGPIDTRAGIRRWMVAEADYQRGMIDELRGLAGAALRMSESPMSVVTVGPGGALADVLSGRGIGFHAERTKQRLEDEWLRHLAWLQTPLPAVLATAAAERQALEQRPPGAWERMHWRNTFGEALLEVALQTNHTVYFARHADHELHREATALVLALQRQRVPAAGRAEAAARLPGLSEALKGRMAWSSDGLTLTVRPWQADAMRTSYDARRDAIQFSWPP